jgi:Rrf2 family protein
MKLSLRSEYALLSLITLARGAGPGLSLSEIAGSLETPAQTLQDLIDVLLQVGLVRRANGKMLLSKAAGQVSVAEIIRLFDGALAPLEPVSEMGYAPAPMDQEQKLTDLFSGLQEEIVTRLEQTTLADLV